MPSPIFSNQFKSIGILGGMGPEATAEFYRRLIRLFQSKYGCTKDSDYPEIYIYNLPLPEVVSYVDPEVKATLQLGIDKLMIIGADFIVCPCNTANTFFRYLRFEKPYVCIFEAALKKVDGGKVGIIGTRQTIASGEFQRRIAAKDLSFDVPSSAEQELITQILIRILSGKKLDEDRMILKRISHRMGCRQLILGCTELPLIISGDGMIDTLQALAEDTVEFSAKNYIKKPPLVL